MSRRDGAQSKKDGETGEAEFSGGDGAKKDQAEPKEVAGLQEKILKINWKTDLSGGIQRVAIANGLAPFGNGKARAVVWTFPDPVPVHREPLYTAAPRSAAEIRNLQGPPRLPPAGALPLDPGEGFLRPISR